MFEFPSALAYAQLMGRPQRQLEIHRSPSEFGLLSAVAGGPGHRTKGPQGTRGRSSAALHSTRLERETEGPRVLLMSRELSQTQSMLTSRELCLHHAQC